jgi:hypothetical protein
VAGQEEWRVEPFDDWIDVNLPEEGSQWHHHLRVALREIVAFRSLSRRRAQLAVPRRGTVDGIEYAVEDSALHSHLWVTLPEYRVLIVGQGTPDEGQVAPWVHAVTQAKARIANQHPEFQWTAVIGPSPNNYGIALGLAEAATIGPLRLRPGGSRLVEYLPASSLNGRNTFWSWPAIVEGTARGYNWPAATEAAARDLTRLCALLSVNWRRGWQVRQPPMEGAGSSPAIPEYAAFEEHTSIGDNIQRADVSVLEWASGAWDILARDPTARNALTAYYEGLLVEEDHPSLALVAFVAVIEAIGKELDPPLRSYFERFRRALRLVASEPEVERLQSIYDARRSRTVHEAAIHGRELARGALPLASFFGPDPFSRFEPEVVGQLNRLSRDLLHLVLKGEVQSAKPLPTPIDRDPFEAWPKGVLAASELVEDVEIGASE